MSIFSPRRRRRRYHSTAGASASSGASQIRRRRRRSSFPRILLPVALAALLVVGAIFGVRALRDAQEKSKIQDVVGELRYACQNMDANALLDIVNPDIADPLKLAAAVTGTNKNELMEKIFASLSKPVENVDLEEVLRSLNYEIQNIQVSGRYARVTVLCTLTVGDVDLSRPATLDMERIEDQWYIMSADINLSAGS